MIKNVLIKLSVIAVTFIWLGSCGIDGLPIYNKNKPLVSSFLSHETTSSFDHALK